MSKIVEPQHLYWGTNVSIICKILYYCSLHDVETIWRQFGDRGGDDRGDTANIISTPWTQNGHLPWLFRGITSLIVSPWRFYFIRNFLRGQNQRRCEESGKRFLGITRIFIIIDKIILISHDPPKTLFPDSSCDFCIYSGTQHHSIQKTIPSDHHCQNVQ